MRVKSLFKKNWIRQVKSTRKCLQLVLKLSFQELITILEQKKVLLFKKLNVAFGNLENKVNGKV